MAEQSTYPQFWLDLRTGTHLRYNSDRFVCTASQGQLQVQHLGEHPRLLHSAEAVPSTEAAFLRAYDDACERLLAIGFAVPSSQPLYQRRGYAPDTWYYRQESPQAQLRLHLSQYYGGLSVNLIHEDLGADSRILLVVRSPDPRRQPSTAAEFEQALTRAEEALEFAATGGHPRPLPPPPTPGFSQEEAEDFYLTGDPFDGTFSPHDDDDGS